MGIRHEKNIYSQEVRITNEELMEELKASREENAKIMKLLDEALKSQKTTKTKRG